jgi:hypothetical protein
MFMSKSIIPYLGKDMDSFLELEKIKLADRDKYDFKTLIRSYENMKLAIADKDSFIVIDRISKRQIPETNFTHFKKCFMSIRESFAGMYLFYNSFAFSMLKNLNNTKKGFYKLKYISITKE